MVANLFTSLWGINSISQSHVRDLRHHDIMFPMVILTLYTMENLYYSSYIDLLVSELNYLSFCFNGHFSRWTWVSL